MTTANLVTLIAAIVGPFVFVLGLDLILHLTGHGDADDENPAQERD